MTILCAVARRLRSRDEPAGRSGKENPDASLPHGEDKAWPATTQIDPYASGVLFDGWRRAYPFIPPESFVPLGPLV